MLPRTKKENAAMDDALRIARRIEQIKKALARLGDMRPGSLSIQTRSWGGQYTQLSYTHLGKGRTEYVPPARVKEVKRQIDNYRKFKELTQQWVTLAIELCKLKQTQQDKE
jgi:hypothetical protein